MSAADTETENGIRPSKRASQEKSSRLGVEENDGAAPRKRAAEPRAMPDEVRRRFVQVGRNHFFPDGARAFTDHGARLTTPSENTEVIKSLVTIAQARAWNEITVTGTERFRKEAWFEARLAGLEVRGYAPNETEHERLVRALARRERGPSPPPAEPPEKKNRGGLIVGRLLDHGRAAYQHEAREPMSYFVKIDTAQGERTVWGIDLERAFRESLTQPRIGEDVGLRAVRQDAVTVKAHRRDGDGAVVGEQELDTHRNRWIIEKHAFFESRAAAAKTVRDPKIDPREAVRQHPELASAYVHLRGAEEVAARRIRDPEDQRKFVSLVRSAIADSVERGEPLQPVRLRRPRGERKNQPGRNTSETPNPTRNDGPVR